MRGQGRGLVEEQRPMFPPAAGPLQSQDCLLRVEWKDHCSTGDALTVAVVEVEQQAVMWEQLAPEVAADDKRGNRGCIADMYYCIHTHHTHTYTYTYIHIHICTYMHMYIHVYTSDV